jgi:hypothetical protein
MTGFGVTKATSSKTNIESDSEDDDETEPLEDDTSDADDERGT